MMTRIINNYILKVPGFFSTFQRFKDCYFLHFKLLVLILLSFLSFLTLSSCWHSPPASDSPRYIITSPEVGEIVYLLQGVDNIVGVTNEVDHPPAFHQIPKVGGFGSVSIEKIIKLNPSLVLTSGLEQDKLSAELNKLGIETVKIFPKSLNDMLDSIVLISEQLNIPERGLAVRDSLQSQLSVFDYVEKPQPRVYVEIYGNPIMSVSSASFIGELITLAGGNNIFEQLPREYSRVRQENVILANPEVIIITYPGVSARDIINRKGWSNIDACKTNRIYSIDDIDPDLILRAGPRALEGIKLLNKIIYSNFEIDNES